MLLSFKYSDFMIFNISIRATSMKIIAWRHSIHEPDDPKILLKYSQEKIPVLVY